MDGLKVLLVGGPPGAGKTTLSRAVAAKLGFASLTVDDLVVTGRTLTTRDTHPALHSMHAIGNVRYFTETPPEQLIADAVAVEKTMWPVLERVVRSHVAANSPTVIDWWLLSPERSHELEDGPVASIWLHIDPDALENRERRNAEFWAESSDPDRMISNFMQRSLWRNGLVAAQAAALDMPVIRLTGAETVEDLVGIVLGHVSDRFARNDRGDVL